MDQATGTLPRSPETGERSPSAGKHLGGRPSPQRRGSRRPRPSGRDAALRAPDPALQPEALPRGPLDPARRAGGRGRDAARLRERVRAPRPVRGPRALLHLADAHRRARSAGRGCARVKGLDDVHEGSISASGQPRDLRPDPEQQAQAAELRRLLRPRSTSCPTSIAPPSCCARPRGSTRRRWRSASTSARSPCERASTAPACCCGAGSTAGREQRARRPLRST